MGKLEKAIDRVSSIESKGDGEYVAIDVRCLIIVTLLYLILMLSVPMESADMLLWFAIYPVVEAAMCGMSFGKLFLKSLVVLPFVALIGIFNPITDRQAMYEIGNITISRGWIEYLSIILRSLMSVQATLILVECEGFTSVCRGLRQLGMPGFLTTQLLLVNRYIRVLMTETLSMRRAREARGYGHKSLPLREWGTFIGQLFLRTVDRSERIDRAMRSRGFTGVMPDFSHFNKSRWKRRDTVTLIIWTTIFIIIRIFNISHLISTIVQ